MPHSIVIDGKCLDFKWKKIAPNDYLFKIGDIQIGRVFKLLGSWRCFSSVPNNLGIVTGFKDRLSASFFLLQLNGYYPKEKFGSHCSRDGCNIGIVCARHSDEYGHICYSCFDELTKLGPNIDIKSFMLRGKSIATTEAIEAYDKIFPHRV